jgi:predicted nucleotidyltransferase
MIIGGQAVLMYGEPRFTKDVDITLGVNIDKLNEILSITEVLKLKILPDNAEEFVHKTMVLPLADEESGLRVDLIFSFTDFESEAIKRVVTFDFKGVPVNFASVEDIIVLKLYAGRQRDIEDIKSIILKNPSFDKAYVFNWLRKFDGANDNLTTQLTEILKNLNQ